MNTLGKSDKISGWLWLPALGLIIQPISFVFTTVVPFFKLHHPYRITIDYTILIVDVFLLIMVGIVSWYFFKRKIHSQILYVIYILVMVLIWEIVDGLHEAQNDPPFIAMIFYCLVIVPYLVLSKRAKATFITELQKGIFIERIVISSSSFLNKFYAFLAKSKWMVFVIMLAYVFAGILLNCALRSLRIDGDILHTFDYL